MAQPIGSAIEEAVVRALGEGFSAEEVRDEVERAIEAAQLALVALVAREKPVWP